MKPKDHPCILTVAGSDSGGGAGIQADLKTIFALGGYGLSVVTALTAQNTLGVRGIHAPDPEFVALQLETVLQDFPIAAAKTGMLFSSGIIGALAPLLERGGFPLVVDPVCVSQSGHKLLQDEAIDALRSAILPLADVVTPNRPEAEVLAGMSIRSAADVGEAIRRLLDLGPRSVLIKGGHFAAGEADDKKDMTTDWLGMPGQPPIPLRRPRIETKNTHGTGCTLSAAIAAHLGHGHGILEAVERGKDYLHLSLRAGYDLGGGQGPVNHLALMARTQGRLEAIEELHALEERLRGIDRLGELVPEVRMNVALAPPFAETVDDVAAFDGRISTGIGGRVIVAGCPRFGASSHMARVVLTAARLNPRVRAAANIRNDAKVLGAVRSAGLRLAFPDRKDEPEVAMEKEGGSLEWGTHLALSAGDPFAVDAVADSGGMGKEPTIRILAESAGDLADKLERVCRELPPRRD
jgi:hydroxymethylpyrimidine kinase / phosphomethylpyrimidine kinase / thiamine-phosphate diphosphorylase